MRISGWGQHGPYHQRPGFGTLIEGMAGFAAINGFEDREPVLPPMYLADGIAGLFGASAALIAIRQVEHNGGAGQVIDLPLLDPLAGHARTPGRELSFDRPNCAKRTGSRSHERRAAQRLPGFGRTLCQSFGFNAEDGGADAARR